MGNLRIFEIQGVSKMLTMFDFVGRYFTRKSGHQSKIGSRLIQIGMMLKSINQAKAVVKS